AVFRGRRHDHRTSKLPGCLHHLCYLAVRVGGPDSRHCRIFVCLAFGRRGPSRVWLGRVPRERFPAVLLAARPFQGITIGLLITWGIACLVLIDRAARSLRILGVRQYFGPGLTVWSVFIPFYCLYRPWAGLGEVRNTLSNARRERRLPPAGIRGANSPTVFYGIAVFAYLTADKIAGRYADMVVTAPRNANEFHANISFMSNFLSFELFILAALLGATTWYWLGMIRLLKQTSMLTAPSEEVRPNAATL